MSPKPKRAKLQKFLLDTHIYSNLLCAGYLIIYGLSGLAFNHHFEPPTTQAEWQRLVEIPESSSDLGLAEAIRDQLGLIGWVPKWEVSRSEIGDLQFKISRPAKSYEVRLELKTSRVNVIETRSGLSGTLVALHGLKRLPGSNWAPSWGIFTEFSILALLYALISGFLIWWQRAPVRHQIWLLLTCSAGALLLVAVIIW